MYVCQDCGMQFSSDWLSQILVLATACVDPAPNPTSVFSKCRCPKCNSERVTKHV